MTTNPAMFQQLDEDVRTDIARRAWRLRQGLEMALRAPGADGLALDALLERVRAIRADTEQLEGLVATHLEDATLSEPASPAAG